MGIHQGSPFPLSGNDRLQVAPLEDNAVRGPADACEEDSVDVTKDLCVQVRLAQPGWGNDTHVGVPHALGHVGVVNDRVVPEPEGELEQRVSECSQTTGKLE